MKKAIGYLILLSIFVVLFALYATTYGVRDALILFFVPLGITAIVLLAVWLIT